MAIEEVQIEGEVLDPNGARLPLDWSLGINGLLIGLKDGNDDTLALGVIRNYFEEKKVVRILHSSQRNSKSKNNSAQLPPTYPSL